LSQLLQIKNDGPNIVETNFWDSDFAVRGLLYLSANAGVLRLLVPDSQLQYLAEMRTGRSAAIERSMFSRTAVDIVFNDGTQTPFSVAIEPQQTDRTLKPGEATLAVWTRAGKQLELPCRIQPLPA
jgi:hypothetical protein